MSGISKTYNEFKEFEGKKYTGMRVGGSHIWYYDKGEWKEKKTAPDKWEFTYAVTKRIAVASSPSAALTCSSNQVPYSGRCFSNMTVEISKK